MSLTKSDLLGFLRLHRYAVQASNSADRAPQAALVGFVVDDRLQMFFDSFDSTRKVTNLRRDPRIALVIGGHVAGDERTVQYEGIADTPVGAELEQLKREYFTVHPDGLRRSQLPGITYFRVRPIAIRYTDLNVNPPLIETIEGGITDRADDPGAQPPEALPPTNPRAPWAPDIDRKPVFNPFVSPRGPRA